MQAAADFLVGGSNPGVANTAAAPQPASTDQDSNRRPKNSADGCVTIRPGVDVTQMCLPLLGAFSAKTFDPPPPPPSKKCYAVLGDRGLRIKKSIGGLSYWAKY